MTRRTGLADYAAEEWVYQCHQNRLGTFQAACSALCSDFGEEASVKSGARRVQSPRHHSAPAPADVSKRYVQSDECGKVVRQDDRRLAMKTPHEVRVKRVAGLMAA